jgi:hypothetical protein
MTKQQKTLLGVGAVALLGYFAWKKGLFAKKPTTSITTTPPSRNPTGVKETLKGGGMGGYTM